MSNYEPPLMTLVLFESDLITDSCPDDTYECDTELPPICIWGD